MGKTREQRPVKLIIGFIFKEEGALKKAQVVLEKQFGKIDFQSLALAFNHTRYYEREFGTCLQRKFISFQKLIPPENLPKIKIFTNALENKFLKNACRLINIDPGYLDLSKLILASTKDYKHRIYLDKNIYAEITLFFQDKTFRSWEWTYPDYKTPEYIEIFNRIRSIYAQQINPKSKTLPDHRLRLGRDPACYQIAWRENPKQIQNPND